MAVSAPTAANCAFVKVLLHLAGLYSLRLALTRDSPEGDLLKAYKRVLLKVHPDQGDLLEHAQLLNNGKEAWDVNKKSKPRSTLQRREETLVYKL